MSVSTEKILPVLDLHRQYRQIKDEVLAAMARVCDSQRLILGPEVEAFELEIAAFTGATDAVACASGTDALWLALAATGVKAGDAVITTPFSFFSSASSIVRTGALPVFVDIDPETLNLDPRKLNSKLLTGESVRNAKPVKAVLPVHLYGQCAQMDSILQIAEEHGVPVIEDAAQAIGAKWRDRRAGSMGVCAAFSFYPTKNLSAFGDAGIVTTQDSESAAHMKRLRNHGSPERYLHTEFGWNARMDAIQAAVLRVKLKHVEKWSEQRREHAAAYNRLFVEAGLGSGQSPVSLPKTSPAATHVFHQYVIQVSRRDSLRKFLIDRGIATEVYYPTPLHLQPVFSYLGYKEGDLPEAERASKQVLALPMFPELTREEIELVVTAIADFYS
jgi:dTDP-4-amino-4,6-dideoxygalactose transaminase